MRWLLSTLVLCVTACGPDEVSDPDPLMKAAPKPDPKFISLHTADAYGGAWKTSFVIDATSDLFLATDVGKAFPGHHTERLVLKTPSGAVYQALNVAFATDVPAGPGEVQAQFMSGGWRVWASVPVAGTLIEELNLVGPWWVGVSVDSATAPDASLTFSLQ